MTQLTDHEIMLQMIKGPAFLAAEGTVVACNQRALDEGFTPGLRLSELFVNPVKDLDHSCMTAPVQLNGTQWNAAISPLENMYVFRLDRIGRRPELQSLYLMGKELRYPVAMLSMLTTQLFTNHKLNGENARTNHEFYKVLRVLNNVSNATRYSEDRTRFQQEYNICAVLAEFLEECGALLAHTGIRLQSSVPNKGIFTMLDWPMFRQAVYNLLDNAAKYSPPGGCIQVSLNRRGSTLTLSVEDEGPGIPQEILCDLFARFTRDSTAHDHRSGLGLGLTIVRYAATAHGGTVLVDTPPTGGTRVTMTMAIRQPKHLKLHSQTDIVIPSPDHGLIMLSNVLPVALYGDPDK